MQAATSDAHFHLRIKNGRIPLRCFTLASTAQTLHTDFVVSAASSLGENLGGTPNTHTWNLRDGGHSGTEQRITEQHAA